QAERAIAQISDEQLVLTLDEALNSIGLIVKHMAGNMRSRWTDFLTTDGEKPDRDRDSEFEGPPESREALLGLGEAGWKCLFEALEPLTDADLGRTVMIRGEAHSVMQAVNRNLTHCSYHCGQIVLLAKHFKSGAWETLTVARGRSGEFNRQMTETKI
ncbi:MAG: DUF1572 family protein, partial [Acidobacteria bacterium]|nr:DUF1572 family protein [Acidobacteriota bacterium]